MNWAVILIAAILLILGIIAGTYTIQEEGPLGLSEETEVPYQQYMIPLIIGAIVLFVVGAVLNKNNKGE